MEVTKTSEKTRSYLRILDVRTVTRITFRTEEVQVFGATVQNVITCVTWRPLFVYSWFNSDTVAYYVMENRSPVIFPFVFHILCIIQMQCVLNFQILGSSVLQYAVRLVCPAYVTSF